MKGDRVLPLGVFDDGTAQVLCWCEAKIVRVPVDEIRAGRTRRCMVGCALGGPPMRDPSGSGTGGRHVVTVGLL